MSKVIAIVGATGAQGGGLARAILDDPQGASPSRALTRKVDGDKARALAARGAEVVAADLDDEESLTKAFAGAYGAFCLTNFWEHFSPERELAQAKNMARAAKAAALQHVIWSTLDDTRKRVPLDDDRMPTLMGKYKVPHFDAKGEADAVLPRRGRADHVPADVVLLGEHDRFRRGSAEGAGRPLCDHVPAGRQGHAVDCRRGYRALRLRHLQARLGVHRPHGRDRRRASHRYAKWPPISRRRWAST